MKYCRTSHCKHNSDCHNAACVDGRCKAECNEMKECENLDTHGYKSCQGHQCKDCSGNHDCDDVMLKWNCIRII